MPRGTSPAARFQPPPAFRSGRAFACPVLVPPGSSTEDVAQHLGAIPTILPPPDDVNTVTSCRRSKDWHNTARLIVRRLFHDAPCGRRGCTKSAGESNLRYQDGEATPHGAVPPHSKGQS